MMAISYFTTNSNLGYAAHMVHFSLTVPAIPYTRIIFLLKESEIDCRS